MFQDAPMTNLDEGLDTAIHYAHDDFGGVIMRVGADTDNEMSSVILSTMDEAASDKHLAYIQNLREQIPPNLLDAAGELIDTDEAKKWAALLDELTNNHNAGFASGGIDMVQIPEYRFNVFLNRSKMIVGEEVYIKPGLHRAMIEPSLAKHGIEGANEFSEATRDLILDRLEHKLQVEFGKGLEELLTERGAYALENRVSGIWTHESLVLRTTPELGVKKAKIVRGTLTTNVEELGGQLQNRLPSPTDNLNIGAKIEDLMYDSVDEFLDDMMHGRSPTAWNVELEDVVEEALNPVATRKGRLNVAQFIENNEASWVDAPPSGGVYRHKDTRTAAGWRSGDAFFEAVVKENGFDGKPSVLPEDFFRDKYRSEGVSKMSLRGMNADPYKNPLFEKFGEANLPRLNFEDFDGVMKDYEEWLFENSNQFKNGAVYGGEGIYGSGTYTAETLDSAKSTAENVAYARNRLPEFDEYWRYSDGAVIESRDASIKARDITEALEESAFQDAPANVINKGHKTSSEYSIHEFGGVQIRVGVDEAIPDVYTELQDWRGIVTGNEVPHLAEWEEIVADMKKQIPPDLLDDSGNLLVEASEEARKWNAAIGGLKSNHNAMWAAGGVDSQYVTDAGYNVFLNRSKMVVSEEVYIGSGFHRSMIPAVLKKHGLSDKFDDVYGNVVNKVRSKVGQLPGLEKAIQDVGIGVAGRLEDTIADKVSEVLSDTTAKLRTTPEKGLRGAKTVRGGFESIANELALELQKLDDFAALADEELYKLAVSIEDAVYDSADEFLDDVIHGRNPEAWARELEAVTEEVVKEPPPIVHVADKGPLEWAPGPAGLGPTQTKFSNSFYDEGVKDMLEGWTKNKKELTASIGDDLAEQAGRMNLPGKEGRLAKLRFEALADEHRAIKEYADEGFTSVNDALRTNFSKLTDTADDVMEEVRTLDRVLEKHGITVPKGETLEVYRGATNVTDAIRTPYLEVGDTFVDKAFVSTTFDRSVAEGFATSDGMNTVIRVVIPEGKKVGWIGNGDVISWAESELLLDRNSVFRVVDIERAVPFVPKNWLDDPLVSAYKKMDVITVVME